MRKLSHTLCIGVFDGVHQGHAELLRKARETAKERGGGFSILTFDRHPLSLRDPESAPKWIASREQTYRMLRAFDPDELDVLPFERWMNTDAEDFLRVLLDSMGMRVLVVGPSFRMGRGAMGDILWLTDKQARGDFQLVVVPSIFFQREPVSSSRIRAAIREGRLQDARAMLGHALPSIEGRVVEGRRLARTMGFPTINIQAPEDRVLPPRGVYAARVEVENVLYDAVVNLGVKPTIGGDELLLEAHLFDMEADLYGKRAGVAWEALLRPEQRFDSVETLRAQIVRDASQARALLKRTGTNR